MINPSSVFFKRPNIVLWIDGYVLPETETHGDGINCLNLYGSVRHARGDWQFLAHFCRISQLTELADWLEVVAGGGTPDIFCVGGFLCPALTFGVSAPQTDIAEYYAPRTGVLRLNFGADTLPPWSENEYVYLDFPYEELNLRDTAAALREQLRKHPSR